MSVRSPDPSDDEFFGPAPDSYTFPSPIPRIHRDIRLASAKLSLKEVQYLVDLYYAIQDYRVSSGNQIHALADAHDPGTLLGWANGSFRMVEDEIKKGLDVYTLGEPTGVGIWARSIVGLGPVLTSGLLAHIDIGRAPTVGHIWRYAGLDPNQKWLGTKGAEPLVEKLLGPGRDSQVLEYEQVALLAVGAHRRPDALQRLAQNEDGLVTRGTVTKALAKRPWNASLKTLCWKLGESFVKVSNHKDDVYGHLYAERKAQEVLRNSEHAFADQAKRILEEKRIGRDKAAYGYYREGLLPPAQIHERAKRWAAKLFLAHIHHVMFETANGTPPPNPYPVAHLGHADIIPVPNHTCLGDQKGGS